MVLETLNVWVRGCEGRRGKRERERMGLYTIFVTSSLKIKNVKFNPGNHVSMTKTSHTKES